MAYFQLPFGIRISNDSPIDGDRYLRGTDRATIITEGRAFNGLLTYEASTKSLRVLTDLATSEWQNLAMGSISASGSTGDIQYCGSDGKFATTTGFNFDSSNKTFLVGNSFWFNPYVNTNDIGRLAIGRINSSTSNTGANSTSVGIGASAPTYSGTAIGAGATVSGNAGTAVGTMSSAGVDGVALGNGAVGGTATILIGSQFTGSTYQNKTNTFAVETTWGYRNSPLLEGDFALRWFRPNAPTLIRAVDSSTNPTIESGSSTSITASTLVDTSKNWTVNIHSGKAVIVKTGLNASQVRYISTNTSNTLSISGSLIVDSIANYTILTAMVINSDYLSAKYAIDLTNGYDQVVILPTNSSTYNRAINTQIGIEGYSGEAILYIATQSGQLLTGDNLSTGVQTMALRQNNATVTVVPHSKSGTHHYDVYSMISGVIPVTTYNYLTMDASSNVAWDCQTGLNKKIDASTNFSLSCNNLTNGMSGDLIMNITGPVSVTLPTSPDSYLSGTLENLETGRYHMCFTYDGSYLDFNVSIYTHIYA